MDIEIIKTDNPDIIVQRTVVEQEIDLGEIRRIKECIEQTVLDYDNKITALQAQKNLPPIVMDAINSEISRLENERVTYILEVERMEALLNA